MSSTGSYKIGKYKTPRKFTDEDKWFRWFTKKQVLYIGISLSLAFAIFAVMQACKLTLIGAMIAVILVFAGFGIPRFDMPSDKYLLGGGMPLELIIKRILIKKFIQKKKIYITDHTKAEE